MLPSVCRRLALLFCVFDFLKVTALLLSVPAVPAIMNMASTSINAPTNTPRRRKVLQRRISLPVLLSKLSDISNHILYDNHASLLNYTILPPTIFQQKSLFCSLLFAGKTMQDCYSLPLQAYLLPARFQYAHLHNP